MSCCFSRPRSDSSASAPLMDDASGVGSSNADGIAREPNWLKDDDINECMYCDAKFNLFNERKHHCRRCRYVVCILLF